MDRMALDSWDFKDPGANGSISQVNRQKSARNLIVVEIDRASQTGTFLDRSKKATNTASLHQCDCRDFSFAGNSQRKSLRPCMHIYRLAISPDHCECMDFTDRRLPCKHIYAAAIRSGFSVSLSASEYRAARRDGLEIIFAFR
jgi:hypothetical protein